MKNKLLLLFILLLSIISSFAQPNRKWATYFGDKTTMIDAVVYDSVNYCIYVVGYTTDTTGIATPGSFKDSTYNYLGTPPPTQSAFWIYDLFLAKFDTSGNRIWATYYGGDKRDWFADIAVDYKDNIYLSGSTASTSGIATPGALSTYLAPTRVKDFLVKFNSEGTRIWATYYGTSSEQSSFSHTQRICTDKVGNVYLTSGTSDSIGISTPGSFQPTLNRVLPFQTLDNYIAKFDSLGTRQWATYYGGKEDEFVSAVHCDKDNNIYIAGFTKSDTGIATVGSNLSTRYLSTLGYYDGFIAKFDRDGNRKWGTYIGGNLTTAISSVTSDPSGNVYVYGYTSSTIRISTPGSYQETLSGGTDVFVCKYDSNGVKLWGTYLGGPGNEFNEPIFTGIGFTTKGSIQYIPNGNGVLYLGGGTSSTTGIADTCTYPSSTNAGFLIKLNALNGQKLTGTYMDVIPHDLASDGKGSFYIVSTTKDDGLSAAGSFKPTKVADSISGYIAKFRDEPYCLDTTLTLTKIGNQLKAPTGFSNYTWYRNNILLSSSSSNVYNLLPSDTNGFVYCRIPYLCGCILSTDSFNTNPPTSITPISGTDLGVQVFPNPAKDYLQINLLEKYNRPIEYELLDVSGRQVQQGHLNHQQNTVSLNGLKAGFYVLSLKLGEKIVYFKVAVLR